jgi:biopolymer transport protein ExbD
MTPLLDVVFLLLTFFIFALVLMVRAEVLDISLPALSSGDPARPGSAITITLDAAGVVHVNGQETSRDDLVDRVRTLQEQIGQELGEPARLFVAADERGRSGDLINLIDTLAHSGLGDFSVVGRPITPNNDAGLPDPQLD